MPIKPENKARYPKDWKAISAAIRERSGGRCECAGECGLHRTHPGPRRCVERNGEFAKWANGKVVLTVAHLGGPAHLPVHLHVASPAKANEVVEIVGFLMPRDPEQPEWAHMMHGRLLAEIFRGARAGAAPFAIAFEGLGARGGPRGSISHEPLAVPPEYAILSGWRLLGEPFQAASITAESAPRSQVPATHLEGAAAPFTGAIAEPAFRPAQCFVATGRRASLDAISGLLRGDAEKFVAYTAKLLAQASSQRAAHTWTLNADPHLRLKSRAAGCGTRFPRPGWDVGERLGAMGAVQFQMALTRPRHSGILFHFDEYPEHCAPKNLKAMCQRCHLRYDHDHHQRNAYATRRKGKAAKDLFQ